MERKQKRPLNWSTYNIKVLKQIFPDVALSTKAMAVLNDMLWYAYKKIMKEAETLVMFLRKSTITSRSIQTAVRLTFPLQLAQYAVCDGIKAITKYSSCCCAHAEDEGHNHVKPPKTLGFKPKIKLHRNSKSLRAGLTFPVGKIQRKMRNDTKYRVGDSAGTYLAAVLEYLAAEILELSGYVTRDKRKKRIIPRHIMLGLKSDDDLNKFFGNYIIAFGGNMPANTVNILTKIKVNNNNNYNLPDEDAAPPQNY